MSPAGDHCSLSPASAPDTRRTDEDTIVFRSLASLEVTRGCCCDPDRAGRGRASGPASTLTLGTKGWGLYPVNFPLPCLLHAFS